MGVVFMSGSVDGSPKKTVSKQSLVALVVSLLILFSGRTGSAVEISPSSYANSQDDL